MTKNATGGRNAGALSDAQWNYPTYRKKNVHPGKENGQYAVYEVKRNQLELSMVLKGSRTSDLKKGAEVF